MSCSSLYCYHKRPAIDEEVRQQIEAVLAENPSYGHRRIALELKINKKQILRVMKKFKIKPYRRRPKSPPKADDGGKPATAYPNLIKSLIPQQPNFIWVSDFTYLRWQEKFIYLATVMDLYAREIIGWYVLRYHNQYLVLGAFQAALEKTKTSPQYFHSDQGSEYESTDFIAGCHEHKIMVSMLAKASPWENSFQESFYSQFKVDLGRTDRFETLGELVEAIHLAIYYYNTKRIHTALKMPPTKFREQYEQRNISSNPQT